MAKNRKEKLKEKQTKAINQGVVNRNFVQVNMDNEIENALKPLYFENIWLWLGKEFEKTIITRNNLEEDLTKIFGVIIPSNLILNLRGYFAQVHSRNFINILGILDSNGDFSCISKVQDPLWIFVINAYEQGVNVQEYKACVEKVLSLNKFVFYLADFKSEKEHLVDNQRACVLEYLPNLGFAGACISEYFYNISKLEQPQIPLKATSLQGITTVDERVYEDTNSEDVKASLREINCNFYAEINEDNPCGIGKVKEGYNSKGIYIDQVFSKFYMQQEMLTRLSELVEPYNLKSDKVNYWEFQAKKIMNMFEEKGIISKNPEIPNKPAYQIIKIDFLNNSFNFEIEYVYNKTIDSLIFNLSQAQ